MQQLSGLDTSFIYMETGPTPMHVGSLCIYDQSTAPGGAVTFKDIIAFFEQRLHKARVFRQRLANVPLSLDYPYWIEDPEFDLEFHLRHIALPKPGDWRQLCIQTARLHARPLDMNRPLWEAYIIEGLDNVDGVPPGSFALVTKIHHAAIDGVSGAAIAAAIHDLRADAEAEPPEHRWVPEREPTDLELMARTAVSTAKLPWRLTKTVVSNLPAVARVVGGLAKGEARLPSRVPRTRFNDNVSPHRVFDGHTFELAEIKAIRALYPGVKVNDVVVAICGGALRKYLQAKHELPEESLVAMAPISVRPESERASAGNMVSAMSLPVRSDIEDPLERLLAVSEASQGAKKFTFALGTNLSREAAQFLPSTISGLAVKAYGRYALAERLPPMFNTVITNVPGVNVPLYSMGSKMVAYYGLGPVVHGVGLFQPVIGYNNKITISAIACREMMPDPAFYIECLRESFAELKAATIDQVTVDDGAGKTESGTGKSGADKKRRGGGKIAAV